MANKYGYVVVHEKNKWVVKTTTLRINKNEAEFPINKYHSYNSAKIKAYAEMKKLTATLELAEKISALKLKVKQEQEKQDEIRKSKYKKSLNDEVNF